MPFKIHANFDSVLRAVLRAGRNSSISYTEKYQEHISCSFACKVVCINDRFSKPVVLYR